jgi:FtsP/CotA-like multicopper oxidase with cupredoxin domain
MRRRDALKLLASPVISSAMRDGSLTAAGYAAQDGAPDVELALTAAPGEQPLLPGPSTRVWQFTSRVLRGPSTTVTPVLESYLGPTIRLRRGQRVRVHLSNRLPEPTTVHWHGLDVPEHSDGHPRFAINPGQEYVYDFVVTNRAGTYWYHPHPDKRTGPQVHMGLAGLLIVHDDEEEALRLPSARAELLCVLQDRTFDTTNQFVYPDVMAGGGMGRGRGGGRGGGGGMRGMMELENGVLGDRVLVNGQRGFSADVEAGWVRIRLLNGSNARVYNLAWTGNRPMQIVGIDGGLLQTPVTRTALTLAPGQRADLLVDLSDLADGSAIQFRSRAFPTSETGSVGMMDMGRAVPSGAQLDVMTLRVRGKSARPFQLPRRLSSFAAEPAPIAGVPVRRVPLTFMRMQWVIDGRVFDLTDVASSETVRAGSTHIWELVNVPNPMGMAMAHPIHLHGRQFRVLSRSGASSGSALATGFVDEGWSDTVLVRPGETVRVQVTFSDHRGLFLYHCHTLEHEDLGMMRNFRII